MGSTPSLPNFTFEVSKDPQQWNYLYIPDGGNLRVIGTDFTLLNSESITSGSYQCDTTIDGRYVVGQNMAPGGNTNPLKIFDSQHNDLGITFDATALLAASTRWYVRCPQFTLDGEYVYAFGYYVTTGYLGFAGKWNARTGEAVEVNVFNPYPWYLAETMVTPDGYWLGVSNPGTRNTASCMELDGSVVCAWGGLTGARFLPRDVWFMNNVRCFAFTATAEIYNDYHTVVVGWIGLGDVAGQGVFTSWRWDETDTSKVARGVIGDEEYIYVLGDTDTEGYNLKKYRITVTPGQGVLGATVTIGIEQVAQAYVTPGAGTINPVGLCLLNPEHIIVVFNTATSNNAFVKLNRDLEVVDTSTFPFVFSIDTFGPASSGMISRIVSAPIPLLSSPAKDANPAWIIYDVLTNTRYGAALPTALVDYDSFIDVSVYCHTNDILISLLLKELRSAYDWIDFIRSHFGGYRYWSNGKFKLGMFRDGSSVMDIDTSNLVVEDKEQPEPPVSVVKRKYTETFNRMEVTWTNRDGGYGLEVAVANDHVDQRVSGQVRKESINLSGIMNKELALKTAYRLLIDSMFRFTMYSFRLGYNSMLAEVGDIVTLSDGKLISNEQVRITSINESPDGRNLSIEATEDVSRLYPSIIANTQDGSYIPSAEPTLVDSALYIREDLNENILHMSMVPGSNKCNGWYLYKSYDDSNFTLVGRCIMGDLADLEVNAHGTLMSNLPTASAVVHRREESFLVNIGTVVSLETGITDAQFYNNAKLAKIGNEIIAYKTCEETEVNGVWRISNLIRGLMGTQATAHSEGEVFATLNSDYSFVFSTSDIGKQLYFKILTFYGSYAQLLSDVTSQSYRVMGYAQRPAQVSLVRVASDENAYQVPTKLATTFNLYWNLGAKLSGFNRGGYDVHPDKPIWKYGDSEAALLRSNGVPYGNYQQDAELQAVDLIIEQPDGTPVSIKSLSVVETSAIVKASDLGGLSSAVIKVSPRRVLSAVKETSIEVETV
ncbi:MAG: phage tail protein [Dehalococcoidia bacterium]|nr:phage tail protein [Dehalococcoidia bacterium]